MEQKLLAVFSAGMPVNVSELCRELGISRPTLYKYRRRWEAEGVTGLVERSRRPHSSPAALSLDVEDRIVRLRKERRTDNGAQAIAYQLARDGLWPLPSVATVHRVLVRRGLVIPEPHKRPRSSWKRFEWPRPNDAWQIDATAWALVDGREIWIMDVLDDHSRALVAARVCSGPTAEAAWDAFVHAVADWGLPAHVMSDNGICFTARRRGGETDFERSLRELGIKHIPSTPAHPQTCGKLERSHRTTKGWLATLPRAGTEADLQAQLDHWRDRYNGARPHSALGGATPAERWAASPPAHPGPPVPGPRRTSLHRIDASGRIGWNRHLITLDSRLVGDQVLVVANDLHLTIHGRTGIIRELDVDPTRRHQPSGNPPGRKPGPSVSDVPRDV